MTTFIIDCRLRGAKIDALVKANKTFKAHAKKLAAKFPEAKLHNIWLTTTGDLVVVVDAPDMDMAISYVGDLVRVRCETTTRTVGDFLDATAKAISDAHTKMQAQ
jgi:hypothetical protein